MVHDTKDNFLLSLANTLTGKRAESAAIVKALHLICDRALFDCGLVYEMDLTGRLCLSESYIPHSVTILQCMDVMELVQEEHTFFEQEGTTYIIREPHNTSVQQRLLDFFSAQSIALAPILDEDSMLHGLVILCDASTGGLAKEEDRSILSAALAMIVRYMGIRMYERKLHQAQITMESILDNTGIDIYVNDFETHEILYVNKSMAALYGGQKAFMGQKCWQTLFPGQSGPCEFCPQKKLIDNQGLPTKVYTWDYERAFDGSWFRVFSAAFHWVDGRLAHVVSSADITDNKRNEALVENLANYDQLTKLPNRRMMVKECARRIDHATALEQGYILFLDIDGFKLINDNLGHDAGDEFLIQLGEFFTEIPVLTNSIYRNGGDEFVAIFGGETVTKGNIKILAEFIHNRFRKPWKLKKGEVVCSTSIGVACYPEDGVTAEELLQVADLAMYQVKKLGGGGLCFGYQLTDHPHAQNGLLPERKEED